MTSPISVPASDEVSGSPSDWSEIDGDERSLVSGVTSAFAARGTLGRTRDGTTMWVSRTVSSDSVQWSSPVPD